MASTGNLAPGTGESVARTGGTAWTNPGNILSDNATDATCASGASGCEYLVARNFTLTSVPANSTINGITVRIEASEHSTGTENASIQLQDNGAALIGSAKNATISGTAKAVYTLGSTSDVWGATLTPAILHDADFGVRFWYTTAHDIRIDYFTLAVEYTPATYSVTTETNTALGLGRVKIRSVGVATETETALAPTVGNVGGAIEIPTGLASESSTAFGLGLVKIRAVSTSAETDTPLALGVIKLRAVAAASESDSSFSIAVRKIVNYSAALETDSALAVGRLKLLPAALGTETDSASALSSRKIRAVLAAEETDTAYAITRKTLLTLTHSSETDNAFAFSITKRRSPGLATEADSAYPLAFYAAATTSPRRKFGLWGLASRVLRKL